MLTFHTHEGMAPSHTDMTENLLTGILSHKSKIDLKIATLS